MATKESNSDENTVETCIFCLIANKKDEETTILKETKDLVCFRDIDPAAPHHYLVVPREHIYSCFLLHKGHINLVERMAKLGKDVLRDQGITDMMDIRLGFHQPPYISVGHLHLHVLAPTSQISKYMEYKFTPGTNSFVTEEVLRKDLKNIAPPLQYHLETCKLFQCLSCPQTGL
ncbi:histidine triad nucleotide-binding protein 3-like [Archocentrus centrarchus]|uniref:histidine triad nucleotide-binding protein 3-like n=1 Tax=Archocentrus centrarchus TaxID=63155 RepID=UPI0011E9D3CA|nr:histidine triad nucleotide-binding protein 3-like [Archocentrus centrarchus]